MLRRSSEDAFVILLRQCYSAPICRSSISRRSVLLHYQIRSFRTSFRTSTGLVRRFGADSQGHGLENLNISSSPNPGSSNPPHGSGLAESSHHSSTEPESTTSSKYDPENIAIIGGGITGLASAHYLLQYLPAANITLYEASDRMGGWMRSKHINVGNGRIVFEQGPRNLRPKTPAGLVTLELIKTLGLEDEIIATSKSSIAAQSRFIYYPDHLVQMPGPKGILRTIWQLLVGEPIYDGALAGLYTEDQAPRRGSHLEDESVGAFLKRRLRTPYVGDNIVSAILHGIYAGDIYQLSVKSLLPMAWYFEGQYGNLTHGMFASFLPNGHREMRAEDAELMSEIHHRRLAHKVMAGGKAVIDSSVYSFKQGIGTLSDGLITALKSNPRVTIKTGAKIEMIKMDQKTNTVKISCSRSLPPADFDRVVCTISGRTLSQLTSPGSELPSLSQIHAVTVMVVNLYYANPALLPIHGFGYLIPRSVPWNKNPERALGVVFDSDANVGQDTVPGTKVTVMLGGHWWDGWSSYPDEEEGAMMAKAILKRHLKIEEEPVIINVGLQKECIPQYTVGHRQRMASAHADLMKGFKGKLAVAGNSYTGVGLNDCVRAARDMAERLAKTSHQDWFTGLERFTQEEKWVRVSPVVRQAR